MPYFCRTLDTAFFDLAEPVPSATTKLLKALEDMRRIRPFFRDRRIDTYDGVTSRMIDD